MSQGGVGGGSFEKKASVDDPHRGVTTEASSASEAAGGAGESVRQGSPKVRSSKTEITESSHWARAAATSPMDGDPGTGAPAAGQSKPDQYGSVPTSIAISSAARQRMASQLWCAWWPCRLPHLAALQKMHVRPQRGASCRANGGVRDLGLIAPRAFPLLGESIVVAIDRGHLMHVRGANWILEPK